MKVLVATRGTRRKDKNTCIEGELVWMIDPCPESRRDPNGFCDCGRTFSGMSSDGTTTTALVREIPGFTRSDYERALLAGFEANGWCPCCVARPLSGVVEQLVWLASAWADGTVVGRRLGAITARPR